MRWLASPLGGPAAPTQMCGRKPHAGPFPSPRRPLGWEPQPLDDRLSPLEWLGAPAKLAQSLRSRHDVHLLYLPRTVAQRVKAAAQARAGSNIRLSTNDAAQGLLHTLVADVRGMPLTPAPGQYHVAMMGEHLSGQPDAPLPATSLRVDQQ